MGDTEWVKRGIQSIRDLLDSEYAVVHAELEAKLAEGYFHESRRNIHPHNLTTALRHLSSSGLIHRDEKTTRGGRSIATIQPTWMRRSRTKIDRASRRKRLLYSRYESWAGGSKRHPRGLIGPAGEASARLGALESRVFIPSEPNNGEVSHLLGTRLSGPADMGGFLVPIKDNLPLPPICVLAEVKNIRSWIYPSSAELFQVLAKSAILQREHPDHPMVQILICRKAQYTTYFLAKSLGCFVIATESQSVGNVDETHLLEVRNELGFGDLVHGSPPSRIVARRLQQIGPSLPEFAQSWATAASDDAVFQAIIGARSRDNRARLRSVDRLRILGKSRGWRTGW